MKSKTIKTFTNPWYFLALGFGSGLAPKAPGTFGTLAAIPVYLLLVQFGDLGYAVFVIAAAIFGCWLCQIVADDMRVKDPASIVWDEFVGLWITLFMLPSGIHWIIIGFMLFRFFDIVKPWPIGWIDKHVKGGVGVMVDDVVAGLISFCLIQLLAYSQSWLT